MASKKTGNPVGPPTKKTPEVIKKLEEVAALDGSVEEMAYYAGVHRDTVYLWLKEDKKLSDRIKELRERPILAARKAVVTKSIESYSNAMDYLSRKRKDEFSTKTEVDNNNTLTLVFDQSFAQNAPAPKTKRNSK